MGKAASGDPVILSASAGGQLVNELAQRMILLIGDKLGRSLCQASIFDQTSGACRVQFCCDSTPKGGGQIRRELVQADICLETGDVMIKSTDIVLDRSTELFSDPAGSIIQKHYYSLDPKGRITVPGKFVRQYSESEIRVVFTEGPHHTVLAFEMLTWNELCAAKNGDGYFEKTYLNKAQEAKSHSRTGRVLIAESIRKHAKIFPGQELIVLGINGHPGVLIYMPTTYYLKIKDKGDLSLVAQILSFDLIKPKVL